MYSFIKQIIVVIVAVVLASCTSNSSNKPQTQAEPVQQQEVDIAKTIWEKLIVEESWVNEFYTAAMAFENEYADHLSEPQYSSNTHMLFYRLGDVSEGQIDQVVYYEMQCYPVEDNSWIAVLFAYCQNYDGGDMFKGISCFQYKDGELFADPQVGQPTECPQSVMHGTYGDPWENCVVIFDDAGFEMIPYMFWPIRYDWTGKAFVMNDNSAVVANDFNQGDLSPYDFSRRNTGALDYYPFQVGPNYLITNGDTGEKVLQLEFEDEHLSVINILSPKIGIAFAADMMTRPYTDYYLYYYTSKPVALGQPIKNVLESEKYEDIHKEMEESIQDGMYTLTQHLKVDKTNHRDILAEYQAKDKDSNIERFRIIGLPLAISLESELEANTEITDDVKQVWALINADDAITKDMPGTFKKFWDTDENGFAALFREENDHGGYVEWKLTYAMLTANDVGKVAYVWKTLYDYCYAEEPQPITPEWAQYVVQGDRIQQLEPQIPIPQLTDFPAYNLGDPTVSLEGKDSETYLDCSGYFRFFAHSDRYQTFGDDDVDAAVKYYMIYYKWDGEKFVYDK